MIRLDTKTSHSVEYLRWSKALNRGRLGPKLGALLFLRMSERNKPTVEILAEYRPDNDRMLQALMLVLDLDADALPAGENEDVLDHSDSVC